MDRNNKTSDQRRKLNAIVRRFFCIHKFALTSSDRYEVVRTDGSKEGEVTLLLLTCKKCGAKQLIPCDRRHLANSVISGKFSIYTPYGVDTFSTYDRIKGVNMENRPFCLNHSLRSLFCSKIIALR